MKIFTTFAFIFNFIFLNAQYSADFSSFEKGVTSSCSNVDVTTCGTYNVSGVDWSLSSPGNSFDINGPDDGFYTNSGTLFLRDTDGILCWESPNLTMGGNSQTINATVQTGSNWGPPNECITLTWFVDGSEEGSETACLGGNEMYTFFSGTNPGNTLQFRLCAESESNSDNLTFTSITSTGTVLPIELTEFVGHQTKDGKATLLWKTETEVNNDRFEIQKSPNGNDFIVIGEIQGKGNTLTQQEYSFVDHNPKRGINYYRLKQIDFDGQFEYSHIISLNNRYEKEQIGEFYPNPSESGTVNLDYYTTTNEDLKMSIFEISGKLVLTKEIQVSEESNNLNIDFTTLGAGMYLVRFGNKINFIYRKLIIK